ncbi:hypothetical protein VTK56DRAFT_1800 [Thermocarpiscus australiensis]
MLSPWPSPFRIGPHTYLPKYHSLQSGEPGSTLAAWDTQLSHARQPTACDPSRFVSPRCPKRSGSNQQTPIREQPTDTDQGVIQNPPGSVTLSAKTQ